MSNRGIAVVGVRLLALYLVLRLVFLVPELVAYWRYADGGGVTYFATLAAVALIAAFLWFRVGTVVGWILPARTAQSLAEEDGPQERQVQALAFSAVGALLLAWTAPDLILHGYLLYRDWTFVPSVASLDAGPLMDAAKALLRAILGALLFFGSGGLVRLVHHLRRVGSA